MLDIRKAEHRGVARFGWLDGRHTFSFGHYFDEKQMGFSDLRVINDDRIAPAGGFGTHPHADMEIFTYVLSGELQHRDSMGTGSVIRPGDVQVMSAGTGVTHSEVNPSKDTPVHLLQIWLLPDRTSYEPRYQQARFTDEEKQGRLRPILSPDGRDGSLLIRQDAVIYAGKLDGKETFTHETRPGRYTFVHVVRGELTLDGTVLKAGDGVRVREAGTLAFSAGKDAEVLVFDLRAVELPGNF